MADGRFVGEFGGERLMKAYLYSLDGSRPPPGGSGGGRFIERQLPAW
jgi:hypothetical protein